MPDDEKKSSNPSQPPLHPPSPRRSPNSVLRCCLWIGGLIALVIGGFVLYFGYRTIGALYRFTANPHQHLYQNQTLSQVSNRSSVVQPLIGKEQTFDIAVSLWIRGTKEEEEAWRASQDDFEDVELDTSEPLRFFQTIAKPNLGSQNKINLQIGHDEEDFLRGDKRLLYHPLYSDILFHGLRPSDKHITASINFSLPTEKFREAQLHETDLLSTFVLIPTSPSLMDSMVNFSSWKPDQVLSKYPLYRTWPFPMGSGYEREKTMADLALESFGLQAPLIQFHDIPSRCPSTPSNESKDGDMETEPKTEAEEANMLVDVNGNFDISSFAKKMKSSRTEKHPHITTWSQLRLVDETRIMNLEAYNKAHESLKKTSCGQDLKANRAIKPLRTLCNRNYLRTGNIETRLELEIEDENESTHTEWAYAPFLMRDQHTSGPMDLIPVPVHRENCTGKTVFDNNANSTSTFNLTDAEFMNVTWHISFTGRSPAKAHFGALLDSPPLTRAVNHSQSDYQKVVDQDTVEFWNSIRGVRKPDAHPRRRILLATIEMSASVIWMIMTFIYWYTRDNTVYISIPGTLFLVASELFAALADLIGKDQITVYVVTILLLVPSVYWKLRTVLRIELVWKGWIPTFRRMRPSHRERASERLDATTSWTVRLMFFGSTFLLLLIFRGDSLQLLQPLHPPSPEEDSTERLEWLTSFLRNQLQWALFLTGVLSQIILNHKSQHFAGDSKAAAISMFVNRTCALMKYVPALVGRYAAREGLWLHLILNELVCLVVTYQAVTLPAVEPIGPDEDED
ncbi:hypothetical protein D9758_006202 [Tetrapyrgos nigripes]|uniref:Uncharacterized protein n=1 Tax=Tetrapyrgos nigripes TaxID=182062 RepID=A0A8H5LLB6_9AGAR|nr:hypothetical protein D9758_006202 [Tetrapyrgos nigripes]